MRITTADPEETMTDDPEHLYARITSGDASRVKEFAEHLYAAGRRVDAGAEHVTTAMAGTLWSGGPAHAAYRLGAEDTFVTAVEASWRLYRAGDVVSNAAVAYGSLCTSATFVIKQWRRYHGSLSGSRLTTYRNDIVDCLNDAVSSYRNALNSGIVTLNNADEDLTAWLKNGAAKDYWLMTRTGAHWGPRIPEGELGGDNDYTPQGLAHVPGLYLTTSYVHYDDNDWASPDHTPDLSRMTLIDDKTGEPVGRVPLVGTDPAAPGPTHSGGVTVVGDHVYVVSTEKGHGSYVYQYSLNAIRHSGGQPVTAENVYQTEGSSYITYADGHLWIGKWEKDHKPGTLYSYDVEPATGFISPKPSSTRTIPSDVNGVAVLPDRFIYSKGGEDGRSATSDLVTESRDGSPLDGVLKDLGIGNMSEDMAVVGDHLLVTTESGSEQYDHPTDGHTQDSLWAQTHMLDIDISSLKDLDGDGQLDLVVPSLTKAAEGFSRAAQELDGAATRINGLSLPAWTLGDIDNGMGSSPALLLFAIGLPADFASDLNSFVADTSTKLDTGVDNSVTLTKGLRDVASLFGGTDSDAAHYALLLAKLQLS